MGDTQSTAFQEDQAADLKSTAPKRKQVNSVTPKEATLSSSPVEKKKQGTQNQASSVQPSKTNGPKPAEAPIVSTGIEQGILADKNHSTAGGVQQGDGPPSLDSKSTPALGSKYSDGRESRPQNIGKDTSIKNREHYQQNPDSAEGKLISPKQTDEANAADVSLGKQNLSASSQKSTEGTKKSVERTDKASLQGDQEASSNKNTLPKQATVQKARKESPPPASASQESSSKIKDVTATDVRNSSTLESTISHKQQQPISNTAGSKNETTMTGTETLSKAIHEETSSAYKPVSFYKTPSADSAVVDITKNTDETRTSEKNARPLTGKSVSTSKISLQSGTKTIRSATAVAPVSLRKNSATFYSMQPDTQKADRHRKLYYNRATSHFIPNEDSTKALQPSLSLDQRKNLLKQSRPETKQPPKESSNNGEILASSGYDKSSIKAENPEEKLSKDNNIKAYNYAQGESIKEDRPQEHYVEPSHESDIQAKMPAIEGSTNSRKKMDITSDTKKTNALNSKKPAEGTKFAANRTHDVKKKLTKSEKASVGRIDKDRQPELQEDSEDYIFGTLFESEIQAEKIREHRRQSRIQGKQGPYDNNFIQKLFQTPRESPIVAPSDDEGVLKVGSKCIFDEDREARVTRQQQPVSLEDSIEDFLLGQSGIPLGKYFTLDGMKEVFKSFASHDEISTVSTQSGGNEADDLREGQTKDAAKMDDLKNIEEKYKLQAERTVPPDKAALDGEDNFISDTATVVRDRILSLGSIGVVGDIFGGKQEENTPWFGWIA